MSFGIIHPFRLKSTKKKQLLALEELAVAQVTRRMTARGPLRSTNSGNRASGQTKLSHNGVPHVQIVQNPKH